MILKPCHRKTRTQPRALIDGSERPAGPQARSWAGRGGGGVTVTVRPGAVRAPIRAAFTPGRQKKTEVRPDWTEAGVDVGGGEAVLKEAGLPGEQLGHQL